MKYDAQVIVAFAESLYRQAASIVLTYTVFAALVGGCVGGAMGVGAGLRISSFVAIGIGALLLGIAGFKIGQQKAFALRLQAQMALCQVQIEQNTRTSS